MGLYAFSEFFINVCLTNFVSFRFRGTGIEYKVYFICFQITDPTPAFVYGVRMGTSTVLYFKENIQPRLSMAYNTFIKYYLTKTNNEGLYNVRSG